MNISARITHRDFRLKWRLFNNEINTSHDSMLVHDAIKLRLSFFIALLKRPLVAENIYFLFKKLRWFLSSCNQNVSFVYHHDNHLISLVKRADGAVAVQPKADGENYCHWRLHHPPSAVSFSPVGFCVHWSILTSSCIQTAAGGQVLTTSVLHFPLR